MADRKKIRKRKSKIKKTAAFFTLTTTTTTGKKVSSILLPSDYVGRNSFSTCEVCPVTGTITLDEGTHFLKAAAVAEHNNYEWRKAAKHNVKLINDLSHNPGIRFALEDELNNWVSQCDTKYFRFFTGGDVHCSGMLNTIINVAESNKSRRFWQPSADVTLLNEYWSTHFSDDVPDNMMLYMETPYSDDLYWAGFPTMNHRNDSGVEELTCWPDGHNFDVRITEEAQQLYNQAHHERK